MRRSSKSGRRHGATRFYIASLGCPKNTVDSEGMAILLQRAGYRQVGIPQFADVLIVNTCGFIAQARGESLEMLESLAASLRPHQRLIAAGCWAQREPEALLSWAPELDAVIGTRSWHRLPQLVQALSEGTGERLVVTESRNMVMPEDAGVSGYARFGASAFLKIADGCSRQCAFCAIPAIKGPTMSRSLSGILDDARQLRDAGILEINLIAQDSTYYGHDLGMQDGLARLLEELVATVPEIPWIRVLYMFPGYVTPRLVDVMAAYDQLIPYVDIPLQHAHPDVLRRMRRPADVDAVRKTLDFVRARLPGVALRTTMIVGFPGETDAEFATLEAFVREQRFDRLGAFTYSHELGTPAGALDDNVPDDVKQERLDILMVAQQDISFEKNRAFVGKRLPVLLEGMGKGLTIGRTYRDAPEIDGLVLIYEEVPVDRMAEVVIVDALEYDLIGRLETS
ncbi:MAG: 30S ribosomal protein S12 methylthiotransferase RimO [Anaerolineae bacterium]|nr:30S ribosomal protein S12 methylthiotransferase RimO [Anaerolineae bacterium]